MTDEQLENMIVNYHKSMGHGEIELPPGIVWSVPFGDSFDQDDCGCKHEWKDYIGMTDAFKYCVKCDEKKDIDGNA